MENKNANSADEFLAMLATGNYTREQQLQIATNLEKRAARHEMCNGGNGQNIPCEVMLEVARRIRAQV